jgi:hypothetical protein
MQLVVLDAWHGMQRAERADTSVWIVEGGCDSRDWAAGGPMANGRVQKMRRRGKLVSEGLAAVRRGERDAGRLRGDDAKAQAQARHDGAVEANCSGGQESSEDGKIQRAWRCGRDEGEGEGEVSASASAAASNGRGSEGDRGRHGQLQKRRFARRWLLTAGCWAPWCLLAAAGGRGSGEKTAIPATTTATATATATRKWQGGDRRLRC